MASDSASAVSGSAEPLTEPRHTLHEISSETSPSQRALELRKFFAPFDPHIDPEDDGGYNSHLNSDGALDSYAENVIWRLRAARAMVSLVDRGVQYFLAGATREADGKNVSVSHDGKWFGHHSVPTPGGLCEIQNTIDLPPSDKEANVFPCFVIGDLSKDERFASLAPVNGELESYHFYAGTPITTHLGVNIGSFFVFDHEARPNGLNYEEKKFLAQSARKVMLLLETKREAAERRRVALMSKGIANFLEKTSRVTGKDIASQGRIYNKIPSGGRAPQVSTLKNEIRHDSEKEQTTAHPEHPSSEKTLDKIKVTLDHAASILRDSLELKVGGVVFMDVAMGSKQEGVTDAYFDVKTDLGAEAADQLARTHGTQAISAGSTENTQTQKFARMRHDASRRTGLSPQQVRGFGDHSSPAKILAVSSAKSPGWSHSSEVLDSDTLQTFIKAYPKGKVWYIDADGFFSSLDQAQEEAESHEDDSIKSKSAASNELGDIRQKAEASLLTKVFKGSRQIIFVPLWDAGGDRWHSGCFVWSRSAVPVFTVESEVSYLAAFTNSVMVEISRLDAITANKMKSDFISSISHEFRSPLHGILASADFLRESELDAGQSEFVATIQNCGSTLLDTINHVLDYSKINSFEKSDDKRTISNELYQFCNIAILCEEIVNGMIAASEYQHSQYSGTLKRPGKARAIDDHSHIVQPHERPVEVILDIEYRDWNFNIQPGALRRIIMNVFGNAQKYTNSGFILVQLRIRDDSMLDTTTHVLPQRVLAINIVDSGRGMSQEYMERKLYTPFAQEDTFATGVGLGLSIVWSIVNQLGGKIQIRSEIGKGTDVEIVIPLDEDTGKDGDEEDDTIEGRMANQQIEAIREVVAGKSVAIWRQTHHSTNSKRNKGLAWDCLERYCRDWFGFRVLPADDFDALSTVDLVIMEKQDKDFSGLTIPFSSKNSHLLLITDELSWHDERKSEQHHKEHGNIWTPIGPYKLARSILRLFNLGNPLPVRPGLHRSRVSETDVETPESMDGGVPSLDLHTDTTKVSGVSDVPESAGDIPVDLKENEAILQSKIDSAAPSAVATSTTSLETMVTSLSLQPKLNPKEIINLTSLQLLAVDDNAVNVQLLSRYLKKRKVDIVMTAMDGLEALNAVKKLHTDSKGTKTFDIIFMDISMPVMDGFDSTSAIRRFENEMEASRSCIVALTGLGSRRDRDRAEACGVDEFMTKPVNFGKIGELITKVVAQKEKVT